MLPLFTRNAETRFAVSSDSGLLRRVLDVEVVSALHSYKESHFRNRRLTSCPLPSHPHARHTDQTYTSHRTPMFVLSAKAPEAQGLSCPYAEGTRRWWSTTRETRLRWRRHLRAWRFARAQNSN